MLKYLTHKLRTQSINDENHANNEKIDGHDSGTESDGDLEIHDMELSMDSRHDTTSPTDTACSSESPAFLGPSSSHLLLYDQNSSEEELEVINGSVDVDDAVDDGGGGHHSSTLSNEGDCDDVVTTTSILNSSIFLDTTAAANRCSSNILLEKRKRSLAHSSDDEVRHLLEQQQQQQQHLLSAPVNFRTSPPLEALKPHRGHIIQRSTTPLLLAEKLAMQTISHTLPINSHDTECGAAGGMDKLRIPSSSSISSTTSSLSSLSATYGGYRSSDSPTLLNSSNTNNNSSINCISQHLSNTSNNINNNLGTSYTNNVAVPGGVTETGAQMIVSTTTSCNSNMEISRSVSPPAKVFHCAVSPRRRQPRHQQQRLPHRLPHRPCLDFDKMQQLKARSVTTWRHSNEHSGELSVFCW